MRTPVFFTITNASQASVICASARRAVSFRERLCGLLGSVGLEDDSGLLLTPSSGVHTFGMRFPIDIVTLDRSYRVLDYWENVGQGRIRGVGLRTRSVLELKSWRLRKCRLALGDQLILKPVA